MEKQLNTYNSQSQNYQIGEVEFNAVQQQLVFGRYRKIKLTQRETLILAYLLDRPNQPITLTEIINQALKSFHGEPMAIRRTIQLLSAKLELADHIEYPYIDCYRFKQPETEPKSKSFNLWQSLKRLFTSPNNNLESINKQMA